ncbi:hypothetical protein [Derxia gummosa]|uniref:Uncharacterized protein n=1 Tax=Derxia gummosa DSM 723 TaxID=1121388 RepID=A0A8B6XB42_9BURK|nr:hypothetical protein [Derxia gummosa]
MAARIGQGNDEFTAAALFQVNRRCRMNRFGQRSLATVIQQPCNAIRSSLVFPFRRELPVPMPGIPPIKRSGESWPM